MTHPLAALIADVPRYDPNWNRLLMRVAADGDYVEYDRILAALHGASAPTTPPQATTSDVMKLFDQTTFSDKEAGTHGDCFRATVCTVLQIDPASLPHPIAQDGGWNTKFHKALREMGWIARTIDFATDDDPAAMDPELTIHHPYLFKVPRVVLAAGMSPRGVRHSVVWDRLAGRMIHDPHPSRAGLDYIEAFDFLMPAAREDGSQAVQDALAERAGEVLERMKSVCTCNIDSTPCMSEDDCRDAIAAADTIRALIILCQAQAAQIAGLTKELKEETALAEDMVDQVANLVPAVNREAVEQRARAEAAEAERDNLSGKLELERALTDGAQRRARAAEAKVAELEAQIVAEKEENRWAYIQAAMDDKQTDAETEAATLRAEVESLRGALKSIANDVDLMATGRTSLLGKMGRTARAALEGKA